MADFISLTCPTCGGDLQITKDIERFACAHCGKEHMVNRGGGVISLAPVLQNVAKGVDSTASELALVRIEKELFKIKPELTQAKEVAEKYQIEVQRKIPFLIGMVVLLLGGFLLFILTDLVLLAMIVLIGGIVLSGRTYNVSSKEFRQSLDEAVEKADTLQAQHDKLSADYQFHHQRANDR